MAKHEKDTNSGNTGESLSRLRGELTDFLSAQTHKLTNTASGKIGEIAEKLTESSNGDGGALAKAGARVLSGEPPVRSLVKEEAKSVKDNTVGKVKEAVGGGGGKSGDLKVTNIVEVIDVGAPLRTCYNHWTQFEGFSDFTKGVQSVKMSDEVTSDWKLKVGPSSRSWKATVQEQIPDERIEWTSEGAKGSTRGVITFH
jgi:uncharacterized membrane protein